MWSGWLASALALLRRASGDLTPGGPPQGPRSFGVVVKEQRAARSEQDPGHNAGSPCSGR